MDGKNVLVVLLLALVALLARGAPSSSRAPADPPAAHGAPATTPPAAPALGAAAPMRGALCEDSDPLCQLERDFPQVWLTPPAAGAPCPRCMGLTTLVASLANPLAAPFAAEFDRGIEAIERAAQSDRYVLQRYWFPWEPGHRLSGSGRPGWMSFRRSDGTSTDLLLLLLATENPSSGADPSELAGALDRARAVASRKDDHNGLLALLGPTFSGSATSLQQQLRRWCQAEASGFCKARRLVAVSGSATVRLTKPLLESLGQDVFAGADFHATVLPDDLLREGMRRFLHERLAVAPDEVADLTEASTDYGIDAGDQAVSQRLGRTARAERDDGEARRDLGPKIPFPMHLGVLADQDDDARAANDGQPYVFDEDATKKIALQLDSTFAALSRKGIRHVGIVATSTRDKIFLAEQFRQSAPNLRVHMYESSIDLADRSKRQGLEGVMIASSYPLFPMAQVWAGDSHGVLQQFPSMAAEGTYNALLALLARANGAADTLVSERLLDYRPIFGERKVTGPSAWITVSIGNRLWPLAVYPPGALGDGPDAVNERAPDPYVYIPAEAPRQRNPEQPAHLSVLAFVGALAVLLLLVGNVAALSIGHGRYAWWRVPVLVYGEASGEDERPVHRRVVVAGLWALGLTATTMGRIIELPRAFGADARLSAWQHLLAAGLVAGAITALGVHLAVTIRGRGWRKTPASLVVQGAFLIALVIAFLVSFFAASRGRQDGHLFFFFLRAMDTGIGLTPTIPLFIVGMSVYVAALMQLSVLRRAATLRQDADEWAPARAGAPAGQARSFARCAAAMREFAREASCSVLPTCAAGTAAGFVVLFLSPLRLGSFEGRLFDGACSACFALIFTLTLAAAWRAYSLWLRLQTFTRALAIHPAAAALDRLPDSVAQRFRSPVPGKLTAHHFESALAMNQHALGLDKPAHIGDFRDELERRWFPVAYGREVVPPPADPSTETLARLKEDFLALKMAEVLGLMCDATRTMLFMATGAGMAALFGYAIYPFQPAAALTTAGLVSVGLVALVALRVLLGIERDHVLSKLAKTAGGVITPSLGLAARLVGYVVVPLGGLIGTRLQDQGRFIELFQDLAKMLSR